MNRSYALEYEVLTLILEDEDYSPVLEPRLIPISSAYQPNGKTRTRFQLNSRNTTAEGNNNEYDSSPIDYDKYQAVVIRNKADKVTKDITFVQDTTYKPILETNESNEMGNLETVGIGEVLNNLTSALWNSFYPKFNVRNDSGDVIGNNNGTIDSSDFLLLDNFIMNTQDLVVGENYWTRFDVLNAYFKGLTVSGVPIVFDENENLISNEVLTFLKSTDESDIDSWNTDQLTLIQVLDLLITNNTNLQYTFVPSEVEEEVKLLLTIYEINPSTRNDVVVGHRLMDINVNSIRPYDSIAIFGNPIVAGATFSFKNNTLIKGWDTTEDSEGVVVENDLIFNDADLNDDAANNLQVRNKGKYANVFSRYLVDTSNTFTSNFAGTKLFGVIEPGQTTKNVINYLGKTDEGGAEYDIINLAGETLTSEGEDAGLVNYLTLPIFTDGTRTSALDNIPWYNGLELAADGTPTDTRTPDQKTNPELDLMKVFRYDSATDTYINLHNPGDNVLTPKVRVTQNSIGVHVRYDNHPESLAEDAWAAAEETKVSSRPPDPDVSSEAGDYSDIYVTMGLRLGFYLADVAYFTGDGSNQTGSPKRLEIRRPFNFWYMARGSILGLDSESNPIYLKKDVVIKNDSKKLKALMEDIKAYAFQTSSELDIVYNGTDIPCWIKIGYPIGDFNILQLTESPLDTEIEYDFDECAGEVPQGFASRRILSTNSIISGYTINYQSNTVNVVTQRPDPTAIFSSINGTVGSPTTTQVTKLSLPTVNDGKTKTVHEGSRSAASAQRLITVLDGQTLTPAGIDGIKFSSTSVTVVDDDPETSGTRADGMGRGQYVDNGEKIMIVHDIDSPSDQTTAHKNGDVGISIGTKTSSGGTVYHYISGT